MIQALAALFGAALTVAACYSAGALLVDALHVKLRRSERLPLAFILGAACLHVAVFAILALRIAYWPVLAGLVGGIVGFAAWKGALGIKGEPEEHLTKGLKQLCYLLFGAFSLLYFFHALAPETSPDGPGYHLGLVARELQARGFERITTNMYAALGAGVEMLYVPAVSIGRYSAAALVHFSFAIALALAMLAYGRRLGKPWVGAAGALLTYASPVVGVDGTSAYNDVAVAAIVFAVFYWLQIWDDSGSIDRRDNRVLVAVGLLAGYAYAAKYTAFIIFPFALGFVLLRARRLRPLLAVAALGSLMVIPWMLKDWIVLQNPLAPFANQIFRNPNFHVQAERDYTAYYRRYDIPDLRTLPLEVTVRGGTTQGVLGVMFLAVPMALAALRYRAGRRLLAAGTVMLATYFLNIGTRFLIPSLPFFSLAMALALGNSVALLQVLMVLTACTSWPTGVKLYADSNAWRLDRILFKEALRIIPQERYLRDNFIVYRQARLVDANVPKGEAVLAFLGVPDAYTSREILVSYQAAFNQSLADTIDIGWIKDFQPRVLQTFSFPEKTIRRIRVLQTGAADPQIEQWSVHELRFFDHNAELPRRSEWQLGAWPNSWDAPLAFDNSLATRWRTWEAARPGMYLSVDFTRAESLDQVKLETSYDYSIHSKVIVEAMNEAGQWLEIARNSVVSVLDPGPNIRRAATRAMWARGIHFLLMHDGDFGAKEIDDDPEGWGLKQVAAGYGVRLYRVMQ
jgi:hypothetical protein